MDAWRKGSLAVVEDSDSDYAMFSRVFQAFAPITRWATAEDALESFEGGAILLTEVELLVVDLHLPGIDGVALVERARSMAGGTQPTICVLTTSRRPEDERRAKAAGADAYVVKPDNLSGLRELPERLAAVTAAR